MTEKEEELVARVMNNLDHNFTLGELSKGMEMFHASVWNRGKLVNGHGLTPLYAVLDAIKKAKWEQK